MSTFHYHASAHAFSGSFTRPFDQLIDVQAASSLPVIGGHGNSRVENFQFREFVSFKKGYTHVSGAHQADDNSNNTLVTATLEGLNVMDVLTADRVVARLYSKHAAGELEGFVTMVGSKFENLKIAGYPVNLDLDFGLFENIRTFKEAQNSFENDGAFRRIALDPLGTGHNLQPQGPNGAFLCSLVKEMNTSCPGVRRTGHCFSVPGFGKIFLGELMIVHGERTLTMIRLELGSAVSATGSGSSAAANGRTYPPP
ncbi:MAG TPA: hypothetical protein VM781_01180 [Candidatus Bathyarchaeia archaeon]|nr:hypothetical protein [Candidatus Bathyarchaeia archaeon]